MKKDKCDKFWGLIKIHDFDNWELTEKGTSFYSWGTFKCFWIKQQRKCKKCEFIEISYIEKN